MRWPWTWFKPVSITVQYFVVTPKGVTLKQKRFELTWQKRLKAWAYLRHARLTMQAYVTRALWLE